MSKSKSLITIHGQEVHILSEEKNISVFEILKKNRNITDEPSFFSPSLESLHDPFLLPDMEKAVKRILKAREEKERIIIFGDYDVDGVSSTAMLVRFLSERGWSVSYRLPHRVYDGYGLKEYFFDEIKAKGVALVITVDCGTRDREPIKYAKSLGIDVIVTDHHTIPDILPEEAIAIINPRRKDSHYPFPHLSGSGVAFKLIHALLMTIEKGGYTIEKNRKNPESSDFSSRVESTLMRYIDFASLGTVADCMPIIGENRVITALGLRQMQQSESAGLRLFLEGKENIEKDADIIGFQIGPRINAAGRMDSPLVALRWLLAGEGKVDEFFRELEALNQKRKGTTEIQYQKALENIDTTKPILFFDADDLDHGIIGLVASRLTEVYNKPSIVIKNGHNHVLTSKKGDTVTIDNERDNLDGEEISLGSCRAPEWCNIIELLNICKDYFIRYGGHKQAAGFTIETSRIHALREALCDGFSQMYNTHNLPKKVLTVESSLFPEEISREILESIDHFRPFGIGNPKPLWLIENVTLIGVQPLGEEGKHTYIKIRENPELKIILWNSHIYTPHIMVGNVISIIGELEYSQWKGKTNIQVTVRDIVL